MTREEIMKLDMQGIETRMAAIRNEMNNQNADIAELTAEVDSAYNTVFCRPGSRFFVITAR